MENYDNVKIEAVDDPIQMLVEIGELARQLRSHGDHIHLSHVHTRFDFVSAFSLEYDIQKQLLEGREGTLPREVMMALGRKRE